MDCKDYQPLLERVIDGEAGGAEQTQVREHVQICADCALRLENAKTLRVALRNPALHHRAPAELKARLRTLSRPQRMWPWRALSAAVLLFSFAGIGYFIYSAQNADHAIDGELVSAHIRSLMASHLCDVPSTDSHTVKPWFAGKLDFSPLVATFPEQKFDLIGGRLDYLNHRPVAALVYQRRQHIINVFTWPQVGADTSHANESVTMQGYHIASWRQDNMAYGMTSDLNAKEMDELKVLLQNRAIDR